MRAWRPPTIKAGGMNIRRVLLDVDKAIQRPEIIDIAKAIDGAPPVAGLDITVTGSSCRWSGSGQQPSTGRHSRSP